MVETTVGKTAAPTVGWKVYLMVAYWAHHWVDMTDYNWADTTAE